MITDHSSAGFEYLLLDRPLIRIHVPELLRGSNINPEYVSLISEAAASVTTPAEAFDAVESAVADPRARSKARRAVADDLFYRPGTATARAVNELYHAIDLEPVATRYPIGPLSNEAPVER
jgi:CDP-glycerol glycerophosphotransferase (TagB/SpsB family)